LTTKTYGLGIRNDGLWPVVEDDATYKSGLDFQKIWKYTKTASDKLAKNIANNYIKAKKFLRKNAVYASIAFATITPSVYLCSNSSSKDDGLAPIIMGVGTAAFTTYHAYRSAKKKGQEYKQQMKLQSEILKTEKKQAEILQDLFEYVKGDGDLKKRLGPEGMKSLERKLRRLEKTEKVTYKEIRI